MPKIIHCRVNELYVKNLRVKYKNLKKKKKQSNTKKQQ
jgi:hypothetical protein